MGALPLLLISKNLSDGIQKLKMHTINYPLNVLSFYEYDKLF